MKATSLTSIALVLVSFPTVAATHAGHSKHATHAHASHVRPPTAMHTTQVHQKAASSVVPLPAPAITHATHVASAVKKNKPAPPCLHEPVAIARGLEEDHFALTRCDGSPLPDAVDHLSVLARPESIPRAHNGVVPAGMRRVDSRLVERLQQVADHFAHGHAVSMHVISGFRPTSVGSYHATAQALDFRVDGVRNEELVAFCKTLQDTGCGYYPNSSFVHLDVRAPGTGHVAWIDASGPGESAHYVSAWPPPPSVVKEDFALKLSKILPPFPVDEHPAEVSEQPNAQPDAEAKK